MVTRATSPGRDRWRVAFPALRDGLSWALLPPPTLGERRHRRLARRLIAVRRRAILVVTKGERPHDPGGGAKISRRAMRCIELPPRLRKRDFMPVPGCNRLAVSAFGETGHLSGHRRRAESDPKRT
jgi:hypothetical protein